MRRESEVKQREQGREEEEVQWMARVMNIRIQNKLTNNLPVNFFELLFEPEGR